MASSCATILDGSNQPVTFNSQPNGAKISSMVPQLGVTPLTTQVKRSKWQKRTAIKISSSFCRRKSTPTWAISYGGLFSGTTDYASDAMIEYSPNMYFITLNPIQFSQSEPDAMKNERSLRTERKVRTFILCNHSQLMTDIAREEGEYLFSLSGMLGVSDSQTLKSFRRMASQYRDAPAFAEAVVEER